MTPEPFASGFRLIDGSALNDTLSNPLWSTAPTLKATPGGTVLNSTRITEAITNVTTASAPGAGVVLPQALEGMVMLVNNSSTNSVVVYAAGGSTINNVPGSVGLSLPKGQAFLYFCANNLNWISCAFVTSAINNSFYTEALTIAAPNTLPNLTYSYNNSGFFQLIVNGQVFVPAGASPAFSVSGKTLTWNSALFGVNPGDSVFASYSY